MPVAFSATITRPLISQADANDQTAIHSAQNRNFIGSVAVFTPIENLLLVFE